MLFPREYSKVMLKNPQNQLQSSEIRMTELRLNGITLEGISSDGIDDLYLETLNDKEYMKYSRQSAKLHTYNSQREYIDSFCSFQRKLLGVKDTQKNTLVGTVSYILDFNESSIRLGFLIFRNYAGEGYATKSLNILLPYLEKQFPGMNMIIGTHKDNFAMQRIAIKLNFQLQQNLNDEKNSTVEFVRKAPSLESSSISFIPDFVREARSIGIVANDAGGAEQISWLLRELSQPIFAHLNGPAKAVFERNQTKFSPVKEVERVMDCDLLITGSGWMSEIELSAIHLARMRGTPCLTILDHWVNYRERFQRFGQSEVRPQMIGVTNSFALEKAQEVFSQNPIWLIPDFQIRHYQSVIHATVSEPNNILVLLEPSAIQDSRLHSVNSPTEELINKSIIVGRERQFDRVIVRLHPAQASTSWLGFDPSLFANEIEFSDKQSLLEDLLHCKAVIGISSYALYIAAMCGKETYSCTRRVEGHWTDNFPVIHKL